MEVEKRSDIAARKVKLKDEELMQIIERYLNRIGIMLKKGSFKKLMIPLGKQNIEVLQKLAREKYGVELECIPVTSAENLFAVTIKQVKLEPRR